MAKQKKVEFRNQWTFELKVEDMEKNEGGSMTIQGDSMTISEMLQKFSQGIPIPTNEVYYDDTGDMDYENPAMKPDIDLTDIDEARMKTLQLQQQLEEEQRKEKAEQQAKPDEEKSAKGKTQEKTRKDDDDGGGEGKTKDES